MELCTAETQCELCSGGMCPLNIVQRKVLHEKLNFNKPCDTSCDEDIPFNVRLTREVLSNHAHNLTQAGLPFNAWSYRLPE